MMLELKKEFKRKAQEEPEKYYPTEVLRENGFARKKCKSCGGYFWTPTEREVCGEPACSGGYTFIGNTPAKTKMDYIETWRRFAELFKKLGYTPIPRYPVVARWRDDTDFVQASIYDFQPYCVSGEIDPPANPLVVPQFCLRFNDIDNVGITGRHYTGFVMIGQHAFMPPKEYKPNDYLRHIYTWLVEGMKLPKEEIQFHEDAWAGGGNLGPSMEFFSRGLELGNQVYMQYEVKDSGIKELGIKVLDMGMGQERPAWFTNATATSYEATFPTVAKKLYSATGINPDEELLKRFLPYSGMLDVEEKGVEKAWAEIAGGMGVDVEELKEKILPLAGIYSIGDHSRSLLFALVDGGLPSNVGGGYNLRVLARRSFDILAKFGWGVSLADVCGWHAVYLRPQYAELIAGMDEVRTILEVEEKKYKETKEKSKRISASLKGKEVGLDELVELYDSQGVSPEMLVEEGLAIKVPEDFYIRVAERHERVEQRAQTKKFKEFDLSGIPATKILYYKDYSILEFEAKVLRVFEGKYVVLDETAFYPTSGGQLHDIGKMNDGQVLDVFKQGNVVIHRLDKAEFKEGGKVSCSIERERRRQLAQHHTGTHIMNGVARELLGEHIWQAGAEKTPAKARLDITHYQPLTGEELVAIEKRANEVIGANMRVESYIHRRDKAEEKFGFRLYQGGAVPGKEIRVVKIGDLDVEACGGTHLNYTGEAVFIKTLGSTKIQDGVVRIEYTAGDAARRYVEEEVISSARHILESFSNLSSFIRSSEREGKVKAARRLGVDTDERLRKKLESIAALQGLLKRLASLKSAERRQLIDGVADLDAELREGAQVFNVPHEQLKDTLDRFMGELRDRVDAISMARQSLGMPVQELEPPAKVDFDVIHKMCEWIFNAWKLKGKELEKLKEEEAKPHVTGLAEFEKGEGCEFMVGEIKGGMEETVRAASQLVGAGKVVIMFGVDDRISVVGVRGEGVEVNIGELVKGASQVLGGGGGGGPDFARGAGVEKGKVEEAKKWVRERLRKSN